MTKQITDLIKALESCLHLSKPAQLISVLAGDAIQSFDEPTASLLNKIREKAEIWQQQLASQHAAETLEAKKKCKNTKPIHSKLKDLQLLALTQYEELHANYLIYQLDQDPLAAIVISQEPASKLVEIKNYLLILNAEEIQLQTAEFQLQVYQRQQKISALQEQLRQYNVITSKTDCTESKINCEQEIANYPTIDTLNKLHQQLAELITYCSHEELSSQLQLLTERKVILKRQLDSSPLTENQKQNLIEEYEAVKNHPDKDEEDLINEKQQAVNQNNSYFSYNYLKSYIVTVSLTQREEIEFLKTLHELRQLEIRAGYLAEQLKEPLVKTPDSEEILRAAKTVIQALDQHYHINEATPAELLDKVTALISELPSLLEKKQAILTLLKQLQHEQHAILTLLTVNESSLSGEKPSPADLNKLIATSVERQKRLRVITEQKEACQRCSENLQNIIDLTLQLNQPIKNINASKKKNKPKLRLEDKTTVVEEIQQLVNQLRDKVQSNLNDTEPKVIIPVSLHAVSQVERSQFYEMNNRYQVLCRKVADNKLRNWLDDLRRKMMTLQKNNQVNLLQAIQLLRDVNSELGQSFIHKKDFEVLYAYQQMCPDPNTQYQILINLKPAVPIYAPNLSFLDDYPTLNRLFDKIYKHQASLSNRDKLRSELLLQATYSLLNLFKQANDEKQPIPLVRLLFWQHDPRYDKLKKHEGAYVVLEWLAKLATFFMQCIIEDKYLNYEERFFFKRTRSSQLLHKLTLEIEHYLEPSANGITLSAPE